MKKIDTYYQCYQCGKTYNFLGEWPISKKREKLNWFLRNHCCKTDLPYCFHHLRYQKYRNDPTVFEPNLKVAFANEWAAFRHGVKRDWSNVEVVEGPIGFWGQPVKDPFKNYGIIK